MDRPEPSRPRSQPAVAQGWFPWLAMIAVTVAAGALVTAPRPSLPVLAPLAQAPGDRGPGVAGSVPAPPRLLWEHQVGALIVGRVAATDVGAFFTTGSGELVAVSAAGRERFRRRLPGVSHGGPQLARDRRTVRVGTDQGWLRTFDLTGRPGTARHLDGPIVAPPVETLGGTLLVAAGHRLVALSPDLSVRFSVACRGPIVAAPALAPDGAIYLAAQDHHLRGISPSGAVRFAIDLGRDLDARPLVVGDLVYAAGDGGVLVALDRHTGQLRFRKRVDGHVRAPLAARGRVLWLQTMGPRPALLAVDRMTGELLGGHRFGFVDDAESGSRSGIRFAPGGAMYLGGPAGALHGLDARGRPFFRHAMGGQMIRTPALTASGMLYVGGADGILRAFRLSAPPR